MPRRREVAKRKITPDPKYGDIVVAKFINCLMKDGKKSVAEGLLFSAMDIMKKRQKIDDALKAFRSAIDNAKPLIEVKSRRVGGSTYQVPVEIRSERQESLSMRWIIDYSVKRSEKSMEEKLAGELMDALAKKGATMKKREETHKMAEANKAFAHYRW